MHHPVDATVQSLHRDLGGEKGLGIHNSHHHDEYLLLSNRKKHCKSKNIEINLINGRSNLEDI